MDSILSKISTYNILNYIFPGAVFYVLSSKIMGIFKFNLDGDFFSLFFFCYFVGMILSRAGSLFIEELSKKINVVFFLDYHLYNKAVLLNDKLSTITEHANMYRTFSSLFLIVFFICNYEAFFYFEKKYFEYSFFSGVLFLLMYSSWLKQVEYIKKLITSTLLRDFELKNSSQ